MPWLRHAPPLLVFSATGVLGAALPVARAQVDPSGPWRTWESAHFRIHAQADLAPLVPRVAAEAERAYTLLAAELPRPPGRIDLVVADNVDAANGLSTTFPSNRVVIYVTPPVTTASLVDYDDWFRLVVTHELAHVFHLDPARGVWRVLRTVFGRAPYLFPNAYQPAWVTEGIATYYESRFSDAGRAHGFFHRQMLLAARTGGAWPAPGDVTLASPKWPAGLGPYAWGAEFFVQQAQAHGDSVVPGFVRHGAAQLWPFAASRALERSGGESVAQGWQRLASLVVLNDASRATARGSDTVLVRGLRALPRAALAPDGRRVAYVAVEGRNVERLVIADHDARPIAGVRVHGAPRPTWVGDTVVFAQLEFGSPVTVRSDLYRWTGAGRPERLTRGARLDLPFAAVHGAVGAVGLGARGATLETLTATGTVRGAAPAADAWGGVRLSPDGTQYAGARHLRGQWDIVVWPTDAPDQAVSLTHDAAVDLDPSWSADGRQVFFASARQGVPQIYVADVATRAVRPVTAEPTGAREPVPLGDGSLLYSTLLADGFALVRTTASATPGAAVPAGGRARSLEPAPPVNLVAGRYRPWAALRPHFWTPFGHREGSTGTFGGFTTAGVDPIGRTSYALALAVAPEPWRVEGVFTVGHQRWRRVALDARAEQTWDGFLVRAASGGIVPVGERDQTLRLGLTVRERRWRRAVALSVAGEIERTTLVREDTRTSIGSFPTLGGGVVAFRAARVEQPPLAISPENGVVVDGLAARRWAFEGGGRGDELRGAVAGYLALPLPSFAHWVLAARVSGGTGAGAFAPTFTVGGVSSDVLEIVPGVAVGGGRRAFPVRGYQPSGGFMQAGAASVELRVPLLLLSKGVWKSPLLVDRVSLLAFADVGGGSMAGQSADLDRYRSAGGELVVDVGLATDIPARVRFGVAVPLADGLQVRRGRPQGFVAIGPSF